MAQKTITNTSVEIPLSALRELQEIWYGFEGIQNMLELMENTGKSYGVCSLANPLFARLDALCCVGGPLEPPQEGE